MLHLLMPHLPEAPLLSTTGQRKHGQSSESEPSMHVQDVCHYSQRLSDTLSFDVELQFGSILDPDIRYRTFYSYKAYF